MFLYPTGWNNTNSRRNNWCSSRRNTTAIQEPDAQAAGAQELETI
jgi:hypothetical protein